MFVTSKTYVVKWGFEYQTSPVFECLFLEKPGHLKPDQINTGPIIWTGLVFEWPLQDYTVFYIKGFQNKFLFYKIVQLNEE
jgi:hypothetical protein